MRALASAVLGMLALAGPAGAAERVASFPAYGFGAVAGVTPLGNGEVAYGHRLASGGWWLGTTERTVATVPRAAAAQLVDVRLAASPERFAWTRGVDTIRRLRIPDPLLEDRLFSARPPGAPAVVDDCSAGCRISQSSFRFAVDGTMLAWLRTGYRLTPLTIDPGDGRPPRQVEIDADLAYHVVAAGGRVAFSTTRYGSSSRPEDRIVVVDADGRELLRIAEAGSWTLQPDGKVLLWDAGGPAWYSPDEPFRHPIPVPGAEASGIIGASGDRFAYREFRAQRALLRVAGLDGRARTIAEVSPWSLQAAGFDGTTLAWAAERCGVIGIWTAPADGADPPWRPATGPCPGFAGRRPLLGRERIVTRLDCPRGCRGTVTLVPRDRPWRVLARRRVAFGASTRARVVRLTVGRARAQALKRDRTVLLRRFSGRSAGEPVAAELVGSARPSGR